MARISSTLALWLFAVFAALVAAQNSTQPASLVSVLHAIEHQLPECAYDCFQAKAGSRSCVEVNEFIVTDSKDCMRASCTTHQLKGAERLLTTTCGVAPRNIQPMIRAVAWTLWGTATIFLGGRLLARSSYFGGMLLGYDDWAIITSFVVLTGVTIGAELMVIFGLGTDLWTLDDMHINLVLILFYIAEFAYVIESTLTKISILLLYLRIFPDRQFRKHIFVLMGVMALFCVAFVITLLTYCVPFDYTWTRWDNEKHGKCINMDAQTYTCAALNIVLDIVIFFMPIPQLMKLDLSWKKKVGIIFTFLVGLFVTICSVVRLQALIGWTRSTNPTMDYAPLAVWSLVELDVGVICACMPGMAGLFRRLKKRGTDYIRSRTGDSQNASQALGSSSRAGLSYFKKNRDGDGITKTTVVSVQRTRGGGNDSASESEVELVNRNKENFNNDFQPGFGNAV
ncbi:CFEM domain-containing protein [Apiospora marii]|uniref:CFEM domain-containing protein n=1 Tax=Apiospora marii TaxID=335849 RepID=A0ABR1RMK0_9PEZI